MLSTTIFESGEAARIRRRISLAVFSSASISATTTSGLCSPTRAAASSPRYLKALSRLGIDAYIHKSSSSEELIAALEAIGRGPGGGNVVSMPRGLLERLGEEEPAGALSERETEVVVLAARGLPNCRIAAELYLSEATVKRHLANVYQKIGVHSRSGAVRMALMEQWIGLHEVTSAESAGPRHPIHRSS